MQPTKPTTTALNSKSLLDGFVPEPEQRIHSETNETHAMLCLDETKTRFAALFPDGSAILIRRCDGSSQTMDLNNVQVMHFVNAVLAGSRGFDTSPYIRVAQAICEDEINQELGDDIVGDPEYAAYLEHKATPTAEQA